MKEEQETWPGLSTLDSVSRDILMCVMLEAFPQAEIPRWYPSHAQIREHEPPPPLLTQPYSCPPSIC